MIHDACRQGEVELLEHMLELSSNLDLNAQDEDGWTPLHYAAANGNLQIVELLLKEAKNRNIDVMKQNERGQTPWRLAKTKKKQRVVKALEKWQSENE